MERACSLELSPNLATTAAARLNHALVGDDKRQPHIGLTAVGDNCLDCKPIDGLTADAL